MIAIIRKLLETLSSCCGSDDYSKYLAFGAFVVLVCSLIAAMAFGFGSYYLARWVERHFLKGDKK
jgi:hypothetical protein